MKIELVTTSRIGGSCNYCNRGKNIDMTMKYPYNEVFRIIACGVISNMCMDCRDKFIKMTTDELTVSIQKINDHSFRCQLFDENNKRIYNFSTETLEHAQAICAALKGTEPKVKDIIKC